MVICDTHICTLEKVVDNELGAIFQWTSVLNSIGAIYYINPEQIQPEYLHDEYFDMYTELGLNIGKLLRYSFSFDPKGTSSDEEYFAQFDDWNKII